MSKEEDIYSNLTPQERLFCEEYVKSGSGLQAYCVSHKYKVKEGRYAHKGDIVSCTGVQNLLRNVQVSSYIRELQANLTPPLPMSIDWLNEQLHKFYLEMMEKEKYVLSLRTLELIARVNGLFNITDVGGERGDVKVTILAPSNDR